MTQTILKKCYNDFVNKETITRKDSFHYCSLMVKKTNYIIMTPLHRRYIIFSLELLLPPSAPPRNRPRRPPSRTLRVGCPPHHPRSSATGPFNNFDPFHFTRRKIRFPGLLSCHCCIRNQLFQRMFQVLVLVFIRSFLQTAEQDHAYFAKTCQNLTRSRLNWH